MRQTLSGKSVLLCVVILLILASLACGSSNEGEVVSSPPDTSDEGQDDSPSDEMPDEQGVSFDIFNIGDVVEVKDHYIRLNSVDYQGNVLVANFLVENFGNTDLSVSSFLSFSAKREDGTVLEQEIFDCGFSGLDGSILPGDKLRGDICWVGASSDAGIKIYYEANLFGSGAVVWAATEGTVESEITAGDPALELTTFQIGDLIEVQNHVIRLNSIVYRGTIIAADFTIENHGLTDVDVSSFIAFEAKNGEGTLLEQEIFDCGTSGLDGKVLPGDRLRGSICWSGASETDDIKLYYEASLFGEGAIVWEGIAGEAEDIWTDDPTLQVDVYQYGAVIQLSDHTIVLNGTEFQGNVLKANFTIENTGATDVDVSSIISFESRSREGSKLEEEWFDCGTSMDGSVIPGDKLRGDVCWAGASADDGIRIYYQGNVFGEGAIVWLVE